jgi:hypothetical protein
MIAALEKHREVPRHLLAKRNIERFAATARARPTQRECPFAQGL